MNPLLFLAAVPVAWGAGYALRRRSGWQPDTHRAVVVVLTLPWWIEHLSVARLARSASLNPIQRSAAGFDLALADLLGPVVMLAMLGAVVAWPRRMRWPSVALPLVGQLLLWWVTVPLYQRLTLRGWFFVTEELAGPAPFAYHLAATALLLGFVPPRASD